MKLSTIYEPIQPELLKVEDTLRSVYQDGLKEMSTLLEYPLKVPGKRMRPALTLLAGHFYEYDPESLVPMATSVELFHIATLVHDDIVDKAQLRRGNPTINSLFGQEIALLLGDYVFARSAEMVCSTGNLQVVSLFAQTLSVISRGELQQGLSPPESRRTKQHYFEWIGNKTASLFRMASESGAILSQAPAPAVGALRDYGWNIGLAFQIVDDILDFVGHEAEMGKPVGSDLLHGALTLPVILLLERYPQDDKIKKSLEGEEGEAGIKQIAAMIANSNITDECYSIARSFNSQALRALQPVSSTTDLHPLQDLAEYIIHRRQ